MKARTYKKLLRLNQDEWERLRYLSKSTGLNQEQVLRKVLMDAPLLERPTADYIKKSKNKIVAVKKAEAIKIVRALANR